jgi:proliferating cell nuclear antigen
MTFSVEFKRASTLRGIAESIRDLSQIINLSILSNGLHVQAMDSSAISLCEVFLPRTGFIRFDLEKEYDMVGVHVAALVMVTKCCDPEKPVTIKSIANGTRIIVTDDVQFTFELNGIEVMSDKLSIPNIAYETTIQMKSELFRRTVCDMSEFGTHCAIKYESDTFELEFSGGDHGVARFDFKQQCICKGKNLSKQVLSLRYLKIFSKATQLGKEVVLEASSEQPLKLTYHMDMFEGGSITFYLAPQAVDP